jgi:hypothetical protein
MNRIQELFNKYNDDAYEYLCTPATTKQLEMFKKNCKEYQVPDEIVSELLEYYKLNNNFFNYFECDDLMIFEWYEDGCLWLGQRDLWTFRCLVDKHKYAIGAAGDDSFGDDYEFDTIEEMLEAFLSGEKI